MSATSIEIRTVPQPPVTTRSLRRPPGESIMPARDAGLRLNDFYEVYNAADPTTARREGERCLNCGAAFCMPDSGYGQGCPIHNKIPEWNELVRLGRWRDAYNRLSVTNPMPEFTSRICPAPCQDACILGINEAPISIKGVERAIIDRAFDEGWVHPPTPGTPSGKRIAIIGSGPAGLAAADRLVRFGHGVDVYERSDRPGGLLTYGVPNMKLDKRVVERRIALLEAGGVRFHLNAEVGSNVDADALLAGYDAVLLAVGAQRARDIELPGRGLAGVHLAMEYLADETRVHLGDRPSAKIDAKGKAVIVIGGGDTGADCIGTALRQGCRSLANITRRAQPPDQRDASHPWPGPADTYRLDYAHREGLARDGQDPRRFQVQPLAFTPNRDDPSRVGGVRVKHLDSGEVSVLPADRVLLAVGFVGHDNSPLSAAFGINENGGRVASSGPRTTRRQVYAAGDCRRGASLIVWAIREGLQAAEAIHEDLTYGQNQATELQASSIVGSSSMP